MAIWRDHVAGRATQLELDPPKITKSRMGKPNLTPRPLHDHLIKGCLPRDASFIEAAEGVKGVDLGLTRLLEGEGKASSKIRNGSDVENEGMRAHHAIA